MAADWSHYLLVALGAAVLVGGWIAAAYLAHVEKQRGRRRYVRRVR